MYIELNKEKIDLFKGWLEYYSNPELDATDTGIYAGVKYALTKLNLYYNVTFYSKEKSGEINNETVNEVIKKCKDNSINAMWNIGLASGIAWVLEELNIPNE